MEAKGKEERLKVGLEASGDHGEGQSCKSKAVRSKPPGKENSGFNRTLTGPYIYKELLYRRAQNHRLRLRKHCHSRHMDSNFHHESRPMSKHFKRQRKQDHKCKASL